MALLLEKFNGDPPAAVSPSPLHAFQIEAASAGRRTAARVRVALHRYRLELRFPFGTSHSLTTERHNALILIAVDHDDALRGGGIAIAEAGLPPKCPHVYCSDVADCVVFVQEWETRLRALLASQSSAALPGDAELLAAATAATSFAANARRGADDSCMPYYVSLARRFPDCTTPQDALTMLRSAQSADPLRDLPKGAAAPLRRRLAADGDSRTDVLRAMLVAADTCAPAMEGRAFASASQSMIEVAVLSALAQKPAGVASDTSLAAGNNSRATTVHGLLGLDPNLARCALTFYTVGLNDDLSVMLESARFGRSFTPHIKIKLDADVEKARRVLDALSAWCEEREAEESDSLSGGCEGEERSRFSVDANCAWTPEIAMRMLDSVLLPHKRRIFMVEQPFPVDLTVHRDGENESDAGAAVAAWTRVHAAYQSHGLDIFADESMRTAADVPRLLGLVDGVNIKMEKCCGYRGGLLAADAAVKAGLKLWVGCMVGSSLNSGGAAQLVAMPGVVGCDLDGSALVTAESEVVQGGFDFVAGGHIALLGRGGGGAGGERDGLGMVPRRGGAGGGISGGDGGGGDGGGGGGNGGGIVPTVLVHGGAWSIPDDKAGASRAGCLAAARKGIAVLLAGGSAVDAVESAVRYLEDDPVFDAGRGSCLTKAGTVECDAMIQRGDTLDAGAVACVSSARNPISLARAVLEKSAHVLLVGKGADAFGRQQGLEQETREYFVTDAARKEYEEYLQYGDTVRSLFSAGESSSKMAAAAAAAAVEGGGGGGDAHDTVGCVAIDASGLLAAGTSTGGITAKLPGRVGDSPCLHSGGIADAEMGAVSTTGHGESILKVALARRCLEENTKNDGCTLQEACEAALGYMQRRVQGQGGCIALSPQGDVGIAFSTKRMCWARADASGRILSGIEPGEQYIGDAELPVAL